MVNFVSRCTSTLKTFFVPIPRAYFCIRPQMAWLRFFSTNFSFHLMPRQDSNPRQSCIGTFWRTLYRLTYCAYSLSRLRSLGSEIGSNYQGDDIVSMNQPHSYLIVFLLEIKSSKIFDAMSDPLFVKQKNFFAQNYRERFDEIRACLLACLLLGP